MFRATTTITERILYLVTGFLTALVIVTVLAHAQEQFTVADLWRFFVSPGIVALIAATFGARAGARSHVQATKEELSRTYLSLLELVSEDTRVNLALMRRVRERIDAIRNQGRKPVMIELEPESVHTMFLEDIEYPQLRKIIPGDHSADIFCVRNIKYVFDRWNVLVGQYYAIDRPLIHEEAESEIIRALISDENGRNFIAACEQGLAAIDRLGRTVQSGLTKIT